MKMIWYVFTNLSESVSPIVYNNSAGGYYCKLAKTLISLEKNRLWWSLH